MANTLGRVLILGKDSANMETRRAILDHFWEIGLCSEDAWTQETLTVDAVILDPCIPPAEQQQWIERIRQQSPNVLLLRMNGFDSGPHAGADATVDELHGPGALVSTLYELLTERGLGSRAWPIPGDLPCPLSALA